MVRKHVHPSPGAHGGEHHEHIAPLSMYIAVLAALSVLTVVTVGISELGLPQPYSLIVALIVAVGKASLVVTFFMHLLWDKRLNALVFVGTVIFVLFFFSLTMVDLLSRGMVEPMNDPKVLREEKLAQFKSCMETGTWATCNDKLPKGWKVANPEYDPNAGHGAGHGGEAGHGAGHGGEAGHGAGHGGDAGHGAGHGGEAGHGAAPTEAAPAHGAPTEAARENAAPSGAPTPGAPGAAPSGAAPSEAAPADAPPAGDDH